MRALGRDDRQLVALFPLSLSGMAQQWFALLDPSRRRTWDDFAHEFLRQHSFSTAIDVSRRELEALRQGSDETVAFFFSLAGARRWLRLLLIGLWRKSRYRW